MASSRDQQNNERPSTYFVQDREDQEELDRLSIQDQMVTSAMGGVLPEQPDPTVFRRTLDIACGSGDWILEAAQSYPTMSLVGIDISKRMIEHARVRAEASGVADRTKFQVMDALLLLEFPEAAFDLANVRFSGSFMRTWDWPKLLEEMLRVTRSGGMLRLSDAEVSIQSSSPALASLYEMLLCAFYSAGNLFEQKPTGLIEHFAPLLTQRGCQQVQTKMYEVIYRGGTPGGEAFLGDMGRAFHTLRSFIKKWGCASGEYDSIYQRALSEMQQPDFYAIGKVFVAWGITP